MGQPLAVEILHVTDDGVTLEISNGQPWRSGSPHVFVLDGTEVLRSVDNVVTLTGLAGGRDYALSIRSDGQAIDLRFRTPATAMRLDVRDFGAVGDGVHNDTAALQAAISSCPEGGTVVVPPGTWRSGPLFLKSTMRLHLQRDARLLGSDVIADWPLLPGTITDQTGGPDLVLGSWEGRPATCHASLLNLLGVHDVVVDGEGTIDGNASFDTWWSRPKTPFAGWRPRLVLVANASNIVLSGLRLCNSPAWTLHALRSSDLRFLRLRVDAPVDSPNTDGINPESCARVRIAGAHVSTGDDCVAIKSGKPGPEGVPPPTRDVLVSNCLMENGHGAVVLGSETAGGIYDVTARDCVFRGTDRGFRIKTRRGRGKAAVIDGARLVNIRMENVGTPFVINSFYFCDPDGREPHVGDRRAHPVDDSTPSVRHLFLKDIDCVGTGHAAVYVLGLPEQPVRGLHIENFRVRYDPDASPGFPDMAEGILASRHVGLHLVNVRGLTLAGIDVVGETGEPLTLENVE